MRFAIALAVMSVTLLPSPATAQSAAPPQRDVLAELLVEVRGLRQAMERAATVGARIQLLVARVQLQEQRIAELSRRLVTVRDELSKIDSEAGGLLLQQTMFQKMMSNTNAPPDEREQAEQMLQNFKTQTAAIEKRRQDLANEESLLMQQVNADQGRWNDANGQLDEIERGLAAPAKKP
jgi:DNA repair exonuclease SbcCD ATPase subunit